MLTAKLQSGYQRDLQRLKAPLFRGLDLCADSVDIMAHVLDGMRFDPGKIELDDGIFATEEAYRLVREEGLPFRLAYQQVARRYSK
jgi:argininosuccinate lyase